jgi:hypothetical protein
VSLLATHYFHSRWRTFYLLRTSENLLLMPALKETKLRKYKK